jgi:hypothetical protein
MSSVFVCVTVGPMGITQLAADPGDDIEIQRSIAAPAVINVCVMYIVSDLTPRRTPDEVASYLRHQ